MNPRQRRGVALMVLSGIAAVLVFIGVSSYVASVNSRVGPMVTVYRVTTDLPAFTTLSSENTEPAEVPERWAADNTVLKSADIDGQGDRHPDDRRFSGEPRRAGAAERPRSDRAGDRGQCRCGHRSGRQGAPRRPGRRVRGVRRGARPGRTGRGSWSRTSG